MFDVTKLTLDEIGAEIDKTLSKLERLQALYAAAQAQDHRRIAKLIKEYNLLKAAESEKNAEVRAEHEHDAYQIAIEYHSQAVIHGEEVAKAWLKERTENVEKGDAVDVGSGS